MANEAEVSSYYAELAGTTGATAGVASYYVELAGPIPIGEAAIASMYAELSGTVGNEASVASMYIEVSQYFPELTVSPIETLSLAVEIHVVQNISYSPLTDKFNTDAGITGWQWDRRRLESTVDARGHYRTTLGGHAVGLKDGTQRDYWTSGTVEGTQYLSLVGKPVQDYLTWTPQVQTGIYAAQTDTRQLFSDYSFSAVFANDQVTDGLMFKELRDDCAQSTIKVALYKRDDDYIARQYWTFDLVDEFTGEIDSAARLPTEDIDGNIITANIAERKKEFLIRDNRVVLNGNHYMDFHFTTSDYYETPPVNDTGSFLEDVGDGQETGRNVFLEYLPVQRNTVAVWVLSGETIAEWQEVDDISFSDPVDTVYEVDYDLGIITMGGYTAPDVYLADTLGEFETDIRVFVTTDGLETYPERGVVIIGDEKIAYYERTGSGFANCIRGYDGTVAEEHLLGTVVHHQRQGAGTTGHVYVEYTAVPRIEYEVTEHAVRTANKANWLDIRPIVNVETNNILQIYPGEISLESIELTTDTPLMSGDLYGPLYYGSDVSRLVATGFDGKGNPVEDIELTISIVSGTGYLNNNQSSFSDITNTLGEIYGFYNHPFIKSDMEREVTLVEHTAGNTVMTVTGLDANITADDIWVFQILKHDKLVGSTGLPLEVLDDDPATQPYGFHYLDLDGVVSEIYLDGFIYITIAGTKYYRGITWMENLLDGDDIIYTRIYLDATLPAATGQIAYLYEADAVEWLPELKNGTRYILYEWSDDAVHPITSEFGAYMPVQPDSIDGDTLVFNSRTLPVPDASDVSNNLGAYVVVAPGRVTLQATGRDPISGRLVQSNLVRLDLQIPNFFIGVDTSGALPIPHGWRFATEEFNQGSGISEPNFITVNPAASGINQFSIALEI